MSNRLFWAHPWLKASYLISGINVCFLHPSGWGSWAERTIPLLSGTHADLSSTCGGQSINLLKHMSKTSSTAHPNAHVHSSHFSRTIKPGPSDVIPAPPWSMDTPKVLPPHFPPSTAAGVSVGVPTSRPTWPLQDEEAQQMHTLKLSSFINASMLFQFPPLKRLYRNNYWGK